LTVGAGLAAGSGTTAAAAPSPKGEAKAKSVDVQLLAINDFHGNLEPPQGSGGRIDGVPAGGAAYLAGHLAELREGQANSLTVAAGDLIGASPLVSALFHDEPTIEALNALELDVAAVGNHEFDEGAAELLRIQNGGCHPVDGCQTGKTYAGADFPYLAANVEVEATGRTLLPPYAIEKIKGVKIGFIGMTLEGTPDVVTAEGVAGLRFLDEADTANRYAQELRAQGVEAIVVLLHEGGNQSAPATNGCNGISGPIVDIVERMDDSIDAVLTGHTHQPYNCQIDGRLVTSGSSFGRLVTDVRLEISSSSKDVTSATANNVVVTQEARYQDPELQSLVDYYKQRSAPLANRQIGTITEDIVRTAGANGESPLGDVIADAQLAATRQAGAVAAFMNPGGIRDSLTFASSSAGEGDGVVTYGEAFTVQPFSNLLTTMTLTGAQIEALLEQQYDVGRVLQPAGITYTADPRQPAGSRVSDVVIGGQPLDRAASYRITVNSFLAGGGDGFEVLKDGADLVNGVIDLDAFTAYLTANPGLTPPSASRITLVP